MTHGEQLFFAMLQPGFEIAERATNIFKVEANIFTCFFVVGKLLETV